MYIDHENCVLCFTCFPFCPGQAISFDTAKNQVTIDQALCYECGVCINSIPCPGHCFTENELSHKRRVRKFFNNPKSTHAITRVPGRGTEESKTNDVTKRISKNEVGLCIEIGRPIMGAVFNDFSLICQGLIDLPITFEKNNPLYELMDPITGKFPDELSQERLISAIIELKVELDNTEIVLERLLNLSKKIDTVFSLGVICEYSLKKKVMSIVKKHGLDDIQNAKINAGLGKCPQD